MKTFKFSLVALVATALFTACSNEDAVQPINGEAQEISFRLQGGTPEITTRATATTTPYVDAFVVYGTDNVVGVAKIFDGETVARQVSGNFDYTPKKYYSIGAASAGFFAYSPVSATVNISSISTTNPLSATVTAAYTVIAPNTVNPGNTVQEDFLVAGTTVASPFTAPVSLDFQHALSRIFVKATNSLNETVVITGLKLLRLNSAGTITGTPGTPAAAPGTPYTWSWGGYSSMIDYEYILARTGVAVPKSTTPTLVTSMEQGMMVLPQSTTGDLNANGIWDAGEFALEVTYDVGNLTAQTIRVFSATPIVFAMNSQYAITIAFGSAGGPIEIEFSITVSPFGAINDI